MNNGIIRIFRALLWLLFLAAVVAGAAAGFSYFEAFGYRSTPAFGAAAGAVGGVLAGVIIVGPLSILLAMHDHLQAIRFKLSAQDS